MHDETEMGIHLDHPLLLNETAIEDPLVDDDDDENHQNKARTRNNYQAPLLDLREDRTESAVTEEEGEARII